MGTKTISIMDDVYDLLLNMKRSDESFSEEIRRLVEPRGSILDLAGAWSGISEEEAEKMKVRIRKQRKDRTRLRLINSKGRN